MFANTIQKHSKTIQEKSIITGNKIALRIKGKKSCDFLWWKKKKKDQQSCDSVSLPQHCYGSVAHLIQKRT